MRRKSVVLIVAMIGISVATAGCGRKKTYAEGCGPLPYGWRTPRHGRNILSTMSTLAVARDGSLTWNGVKISDATAKDYLTQVGEMDPAPVTRITFAGETECVTVDRLRREIANTPACQNSLCIEGKGRTWIIGDVGTDRTPFDPGNAPEFQNWQ